MDIKETDAVASGSTVMLNEGEYYKYIFKKTEKIACAVFYILRSESDMRHDDAVIDDLEKGARQLLDTALVSLTVGRTHIDTIAQELRANLVALESYLRVAHASRYLDTQILEVFVREIYSLQRSLRAYLDRPAMNPFAVVESDTAPRERRTTRPVAVAGTSPKRESAHDGQLSRRDRILAVLRDKGSATIKDITDVVTDCSEKTVQRELIALIKDNIVHREGERRWSKYNLI